uniref:Uncharacterized protein n=1 Tax=Anopheles minimus TaxID=112268 RepID=A0A182WQA4_9DIPT
MATAAPAPAGVGSLLQGSSSSSSMMLPFVVKAEKPDEENGGVGGEATSLRGRDTGQLSSGNSVPEQQML